MNQESQYIQFGGLIVEIKQVQSLGNTPCQACIRGHWCPAIALETALLTTGNQIYCAHSSVYLIQLANKGSGEPEHQRYWLGYSEVRFQQPEVDKYGC